MFEVWETPELCRCPHEVHGVTMRLHQPASRLLVHVSLFFSLPCMREKEKSRSGRKIFLSAAAVADGKDDLLESRDISAVSNLEVSVVIPFGTQSYTQHFQPLICGLH